MVLCLEARLTVRSFLPNLRVSLLSRCMCQALPQKRCKGRQVDGQPLSGMGIFDGSAKQFAILAHPEVDHEREISSGCQRLRVCGVFTQLVSPFPAWHTRDVSPPSSLVVLTPHLLILAYPAQFPLNICSTHAQRRRLLDQLVVEHGRFSGWGQV
jgi:hypothetical protein